MDAKTLLCNATISVALAGTAIAPAHSASDDMTKAASHYVKVLFENDRVRVLETPVKPGETIPMHTHATARVVYVMNPLSEKITRPGEAPRIFHRKAGDVVFNEAESLTVENVGTTEGRNIVVELKDKAVRTHGR